MSSAAVDGVVLPHGHPHAHAALRGTFSLDHVENFLGVLQPRSCGGRDEIRQASVMLEATLFGLMDTRYRLPADITAGASEVYP